MDKRTKTPPPLLEEWAWYPLKEWQWEPQLAKIELETCRDYSFGRLIVHLERNHKQLLGITRSDGNTWLEDCVIVRRRAWRIQEFTNEVQENPIWFTYPPTRTLMLYPEWPNVPYLKIDPAERLRRIETFSSALSKEDQRAEREYSLDPRKPDRPAPPSMAKRQTELEYLLNPQNPSTGEKTIIEIGIPKNLSHEQVMKAFEALLKTHCPGQGKPYRKSPGRGSERAKIIDDLNALGVYWLCKIAKRQRMDVMTLIRHPISGAQVYSQEKKLDNPLRRIQKLMPEFWLDAMGNLVPLEPLSPV